MATAGRPFSLPASITENKLFSVIAREVLADPTAAVLDTVIRADRCLSEDRRRHDRVFAC
jgi:hypothetical protein